MKGPIRRCCTGALVLAYVGKFLGLLITKAGFPIGVTIGANQRIPCYVTGATRSCWSVMSRLLTMGRGSPCCGVRRTSS